MKPGLRVFSFLLSILFLLNICIPVSASELPETIRIGLFYGSTAKETVTFASAEGVYLYDTTFDSLLGTVTESVSVSAAEENFMVSGLGTFESEVMLAVPVNGKITVNDKEYRGYIHLLRQGNRMTVVNVVKLEEYLYSVVGREMSPSWHPEALKAQAVCARNYAVQSLNKHKSYGFDLCSTTDCQAYGGTATEDNRTISAVDATAGVTVTYEGKLAQLYFFASDGGSTESSQNVWSATLPYLTGVEDPYEDTSECSRGIWSVTFTKEELQEKFPNIGEILDVKVNEYTPMGSVLEVEVVGTEGSEVFRKEKARTAFGLNSQKYTVSASGGVSLYAYDGTTISGGETVVTASGTESLSGSSVTVVSAAGTKTVTASPSSFTFSGEGWGHRIAMSQYGAKAMAEQGFTYDEILKFYFKGVTVE